MKSPRCSRQLILLRFVLIAFGLLLPYLARLPRGMPWLRQYTECGSWGGILFLSAFQAIPIAALLALSFAYHTRVAWLLPTLAGFAYLGWEHSRLDLASDAQASLGLIVIPILSLAPIAIGALGGFCVDRVLTRSRS